MLISISVVVVTVRHRQSDGRLEGPGGCGGVVALPQGASEGTVSCFHKNVRL